MIYDTGTVAAAAELTFRQFRGEADYPQMATLVNAMDHADGKEEVVTVDEIANEYEHLDPGIDLSRDMVMVEADGALVGYGGVECQLSLDGERVFYQDLVAAPDGRRVEVERAVLRFNERRAREMVAEQPMDRPSVLSVWRPDGAIATAALLRDEGYAPVRFFFQMRRDLAGALPDRPMPSGLEIRAFEPTEAGFRALHEANREAFRDHWGAREWTEEDYQRWRHMPHWDVALWQVAWDAASGEIAGFSINTIFHADNERYGFSRGWVDQLGVRRPWRGRGLAKALLSLSLVALRARGLTEAMLGVDAANPTGALQLYEGLGFEVYKRSAVWRKALE
jgi:mycothiol synthase